jgi:hypothetical protein
MPVAVQDLGPLLSVIRAHKYVDGIAVEAEVSAVMVGIPCENGWNSARMCNRARAYVCV